MADRMKRYHVTWTIEAYGNSPEDAARAALAIQRDPLSLAVVFDVMPLDRIGVTDPDTHGSSSQATTVRVDLGPWPPKVTKGKNCEHCGAQDGVHLRNCQEA
ncbi:MAG: hypothetical protein IH822_05900 [Chloroflexi bacterium]|nr:hypothetical protein [Chloroflexota bacterium]